MEDFDLAPLEARALALVEAAKKAGADAADAVVASSRSTGVDVRLGKIEETDSSENDAFSLRAFVGDRSAAVSANRGGDVNQLAERVVAMVKVSPDNPHSGLADIDRLATAISPLDLLCSETWSEKEMAERAREMEDAAMGVDGVEQISGASCGQGLGGTVLATSHGFLGSYAASRFSLSVAAVARGKDGMERDYDFDTRRFPSDLRSARDIGLEAGKRASRRVDPKPVKTGSVPIVFEPRAGRSIAGHMLGAINGTSVARKTTFLREKMGEAIAHSSLTLRDLPLIKRGIASRAFDGEGVACEELVLIKDGVLCEWLLDSASARELGLATNGRANRSGSSTSPGSTNVQIDAGTKTAKEVLSTVVEGFFVTELIGQGVNLVTGDYSRGASGFWIENGELTHPVSEVTIAGNLADMFANIILADDVTTDSAINVPTMLVEGMMLAGN